MHVMPCVKPSNAKSSRMCMLPDFVACLNLCLVEYDAVQLGREAGAPRETEGDIQKRSGEEMKVDWDM